MHVIIFGKASGSTNQIITQIVDLKAQGHLTGYSGKDIRISP